LGATMPDEEEGGSQMCKCTQCGDGDGCKISLGFMALMLFGPLCDECDPVPHTNESLQKNMNDALQNWHSKQERERRSQTSTGSDDTGGKKKKRSAD